MPLAEKVSLLRRFRASFDLGEDFIYGLFAADGTRVVGGSGLHTRVGPNAFEIGYWIRASEAGRGLATEAAGTLSRVGLELCGADRIEIRVDPANEPSLAVPRKLGFREEATLRRRLENRTPEGAPADVIVFSLFRDDLAGTPVAELPFEAYDAAGDRLT